MLAGCIWSGRIGSVAMISCPSVTAPRSICDGKRPVERSPSGGADSGPGCASLIAEPTNPGTRPLLAAWPLHRASHGPPPPLCGGGTITLLPCPAAGAASRREPRALMPRRHLGQFEQDVAGRLGVDEGDAAIAVADQRLLVQQRRALGLQLSESGVDVLDLKTDVVEALALLRQPFGRFRGRRQPLQQLDIALADRQHREPRRMRRQVL